jgi:phenol 2-monooxygenase
MERQPIAKQLIDFDREFSKLFSRQPARSGDAEREGVDPEQFQRYFVAQGRFTAGVATRYSQSMLTAEATFQHLAQGFPVGRRFHSAPVVRLADAKPIHLGHVARADGAWRVYMSPTRTTRWAETPAPGNCPSSWSRTRLRPNASRQRVPTPTR